MEIFRLSVKKYSDKLQASGVANRWNRTGQYVLYSAGSRSLSTLELIVHKGAVNPSDNYKVMILSIPDDEKYFKDIKIKMLPDNWRKMSGYSELQDIGSKWYNKNESLVMRIPSAVIPNEFNFVINAEHPDFKKKVKLVRTEDYFWDERLL